MIQDINLRTSPQVAATSDMLRAEVAKTLNIPCYELHDMRITRRSIDARQRNVILNLTVRAAYGNDTHVPLPAIPSPTLPPLPHDAPQIIIVGAGPAGLFAALTAVNRGMRPVILERGADVDERRLTLSRLSRLQQVDPDTNYCFGEGGAGAYSDGKLFTRSKKRGSVDEVLLALVAHGASTDILIDAHPHIGSDKLPAVIKSIRQSVINAGGIVRFHTRVDSLIIEEGKVTGVITANGHAWRGPVILATGHSARDTYRMLHSCGVPLQAKGLAIGTRLEHPQHIIDRIQYHSPQGRGQWLPAAEYSFVEQVEGRGVYSFCMCPGGVVVPSASAPGQSAVNGMSASARASRWANSGIVVEVHPGDIEGYAHHGPLEMLELQDELEKGFFAAASNTLRAPAQRMTDFCNSKISTTLPPSSYIPGLCSLPLHFLLPPFISRRMQEGLKRFGRKSKGFLTPQAVLIGLESRTSSPIRIPRNKDSLQHPSLPGLYPCGEGAGFAGGIVSAAIDGMRCASAVADTISPPIP